jgi:hypothetical protein
VVDGKIVEHGGAANLLEPLLAVGAIRVASGQREKRAPSRKTDEGLPLLEQHERALARLYSEYSRACPEWAVFWSGLAGEEEAHAKWVNALAARVPTGEVRYDGNVFRIAALRHSLEYVEFRIAEASTSGTSPVKALSIAHDLEAGMIDRKLLTAFDSDSAEVQGVLEKLAAQTAEHTKRIHDEWVKARSSS